MKNQVYILGALVIALFGLTSFNPHAHQFKVAQIEGSASFAQTKKPTKAELAAAKKAKEEEAAARKREQAKLDEATAKAQRDAANLFKRTFEIKNEDGSVYYTSKTSGSDIARLVSEDKKTYVISRVQTLEIGTSNNLTFSVSGKSDTVQNTLRICVKEVSNTDGGVCTTCLPQEAKCMNRSDIDYTKLTEGDQASFKNLITAASTLIKGITKENAEEQAKLDEDKKNCKYDKNYDKILECAHKGYEDAKTKEEKKKYARLFRNAAFKLAKIDGEDADLCGLIGELELTTAHEPELYKASAMSCRLSQAYKEVTVYDRLKGGYTKMNMFDYYQYRLDYTIQLGQQNVENWQYLGNQRMANESSRQLQNDIYSLSREYRGRLRSMFGTTSSIRGDDYGISSTDYATLIGPFVNTASGFADIDGREGRDLLGLASLANDYRSGFDPITGRRDTLERRYYDPLNPTSSIANPSSSIANTIGNRATQRGPSAGGPFDGRLWLPSATGQNLSTIN